MTRKVREAIEYLKYYLHYSPTMSTTYARMLQSIEVLMDYAESKNRRKK